MRSVLTLVMVLLSGCQATSEEARRPSPADAPRLLVAMERGPCFGACPVYKVEVFTDGLVRFKGQRFVKVTEPVEAKLTEAQLTAIAERLQRIEFKWADYTERNATDLPSVELTHEGRTLRHYHGDASAPEALTKLEDDLDALIGTQRWIKGEAADR